MKHSSSKVNANTNPIVLGCGLLALFCASAAVADTRTDSAAASAATRPSMPDRFDATTASMTPSGATLRIDVREWPDAASRAAVVAELAQESGARDSLAGLPTIGYVWQSGSAVGFALKYAHRVATPQGERVTFVIDKLLGSYDLNPWVANAPAPPSKLDYSVIELYLDGSGGGDGTLSLAAELKLDEPNALVSLAADAGAPRVLANAKLEPKPYWESGK